MLPSPGTVPLSVWKLPRTRKVDLAGNLLTRFTGVNDVINYILAMLCRRVGWGGSVEVGVVLGEMEVP